MALAPANHGDGRCHFRCQHPECSTRTLPPAGASGIAAAASVVCAASAATRKKCLECRERLSTAMQLIADLVELAGDRTGRPEIFAMATGTAGRSGAEAAAAPVGAPALGPA